MTSSRTKLPDHVYIQFNYIYIYTNSLPLWWWLLRSQLLISHWDTVFVFRGVGGLRLSTNFGPYSSIFRKIKSHCHIYQQETWFSRFDVNLDKTNVFSLKSNTVTQVKTGQDFFPNLHFFIVYPIINHNTTTELTVEYPVIINAPLNFLTPNVNYSWCTAPLTSKVAFYIFIQQIYLLNILNMVYALLFFSSKCSLFHNSNVFCSCIIHILYTGCAKIKKIIPASKV